MFDEAHKKVRRRFPRNPCKLLQIWSVRGDETLYREVMEEGIWLKDEDGVPEELRIVAAVLTDVLGFSVSVQDVWKHRHGRCAGCVDIAKGLYD